MPGTAPVPYPLYSGSPGRKPDAKTDRHDRLPAPTTETEARIRHVSRQCLDAFEAHRPQEFVTALDLFRATRLNDWVRDDEARRSCGWRELATGGLEVFDIECEHLQVFDEPYISTLIDALNARMQRRAGGARTRPGA